jgi:hypothetical protein
MVCCVIQIDSILKKNVYDTNVMLKGETWWILLWKLNKCQMFTNLYTVYNYCTLTADFLQVVSPHYASKNEDIFYQVD